MKRRLFILFIGFAFVWCVQADQWTETTCANLPDDEAGQQEVLNEFVKKVEFQENMTLNDAQIEALANEIEAHCADYPNDNMELVYATSIAVLEALGY